MHRRRLVTDDELRALGGEAQRARAADAAARAGDDRDLAVQCAHVHPPLEVLPPSMTIVCPVVKPPARLARKTAAPAISSGRSEEHTSELQSLMRSSYAVFCLKKKTPMTSNNT